MLATFGDRSEILRSWLALSGTHREVGMPEGALTWENQGMQAPSLQPGRRLFLERVVREAKMLVQAQSVERAGMPAVIFDGDDTLWATEALYDSARDQAAKYVEKLGFDRADFVRSQKRIDLERVAIMGVSRERFPGSSVLAAEEIAQKQAARLNLHQRRKVATLSSLVFQEVAPAVPSAEAVLRELHDNFQIALLTKGDDEIQRKRLADSGLFWWIDFVHIVDEKNVDAFRFVLSKLQAVPAESWSVGNSYQSDIQPALQLGMHAIWVDAYVWDHEKTTEVPASPSLIALEDLADVPSVIARTTS